MRARQIGWLVLLVGLPFSPFLGKALDIWHWQTLWVHAGLIVLFGLTLFSGGQVRQLPDNKPLAIWMFWSLGWFLWNWTVQIPTGRYPMGLLMPFGHVIAIFGFYWLAISTWTYRHLDEILRWLAYALVVLLAYNILQLLNLDQFFQDLDVNFRDKDQLVGTIGNTTHWAGYLACGLPVLLYQRGRFWQAMSLLTCLVIVLNNSVSGFMAMLFVLGFWFWHYWRKWGLTILGTGIVIFGIWLAQHLTWLNPEGRLNAWQEFWRIYAQGRTITGFGLGFIRELSIQIKDGPIFQWRHVHNEFFQIMIEQGVIGLSIVLWGVADAWRKGLTIQPLRLQMVFLAIFGAFLLNCPVNFPAHLWLLGSMGLFAYCSIYVLAQEA